MTIFTSQFNLELKVLMEISMNLNQDKIELKYYNHIDYIETHNISGLLYCTIGNLIPNY